MTRRRTALVAGAVAVAAGGVGGWRWLAGSGRAASEQSGDPVDTAPVVRADLTAREQVPGTLGYAGDWPIVHSGPSGVLTAAPPPSTVVRRGQRLYEVDGAPVWLLLGNRPVWREFRSGIPPGEDVRQLEANLVALGLGGLTVDGRFTAATADVVSDWQRRLGLTRTGRLPLGSVVFAPEPVRVVEVLVPIGGRISGGPVLRGSSTRQVVTVALPTSRQGQVRTGGAVEVALPGGRLVPATVADVGRVAMQSDGGPPTIAVTVTLDGAVPGDLLDQAPVQVTVTTARRTGVLAVPLTALLAAAAGGYQVVVVDGTARRGVPVRPGLVDERAGLVEVTGDSGLTEGMRVEVPRR